MVVLCLTFQHGAYTNTYLLSSFNMGGLATYDLFSQYQELVGRMFVRL